jgi:chromodomain-helicase-DNA-binding protein 7
MDSYELFGEDVGGNMLEGLSELGGDNFTDVAGRGSQPPANAGYAQSQPYQLPGEMHSHQGESPLQKLASFGPPGGAGPGAPDYNPGNHMDHFHSNHSGSAYGSSRVSSGLRPNLGQSAPPQYSPYSDAAGGMYGTTDQAALQAWSNYPAPGISRHYPHIAQPSYRQHMSYQQQPSQESQQKPGQYVPMMTSHQAPSSVYSRSQQQSMVPYQNMMYSNTSPGYSAYGHQQNTTTVSSRIPPHHMQQYPQQQMQMPEIPSPQAPSNYNHLQSQMTTHPAFSQQPQPPQQQQSQPQQSQQIPQRSLGIDVPSNPPYGPSSGGNQSKPHTSQGGSPQPQYRAQFPQLSPQISPRPQMSPRPHLSPRPANSTAIKPTTHSPHPHSAQSNMSPRPATALTPKAVTTPSPSPYAQQSTLQQLEQMVMPTVNTNSSTDYPTYRSGNNIQANTSPHWQAAPRPSHNGGMVSQNLNDQGIPGYSSMSSEDNQNLDSSKSQSNSNSSSNLNMNSLSNMGESNSIPSQNNLDYPTNTQNKYTILESQHIPVSHSADMPPTLEPQTNIPPVQPQQQPSTQNSSSMEHMGSNNMSSTNIGFNDSMPQYQNGNKMEEMINNQPPDAPQQMQHSQSSMYDPRGPPPGMYHSSPISHQQEMAALQQQLQELYCMPPSGPDHQLRVWIYYF